MTLRPRSRTQQVQPNASQVTALAAQMASPRPQFSLSSLADSHPDCFKQILTYMLVSRLPLVPVSKTMRVGRRRQSLRSFRLSGNAQSWPIYADVALLFVSRTIYQHAKRIIYGANKFKAENLSSMHHFLVAIGSSAAFDTDSPAPISLIEQVDLGCIHQWTSASKLWLVYRRLENANSLRSIEINLNQMGSGHIWWARHIWRQAHSLLLSRPDDERSLILGPSSSSLFDRAEFGAILSELHEKWTRQRSHQGGWSLD
jgi:hypothetical protein